MKILVCGSRAKPVTVTQMFLDIDTINEDVYKDTLVDIIVGDCPTGADATAVQIKCESSDIQSVEVFYADWDKHGKAAGPIRNQQMVDARPDAVLAYWDGQSRGTLDTITRAAKAGIPVFIAGAKETE